MTDDEALSMGVCPDDSGHRVIRYVHPETGQKGYRCNGCDVFFSKMGSEPFTVWLRNTGFTKIINDYWAQSKK